MIRNAGRSHEIDMCNGPILPKMLQFTLPLMASSLLQLFFNTADIIVVGRFAGDNSLAAVGSNTSLINLFTHLFIGMSVAGNILASRYYGAKEKEALHQTVHTSMLLSLISGTLLAFVGFFSARTILTWMKSPPEVLDLAVLYLQIYFLGMPATMLYNFGAALLRAVGDTKRPLYYLTAAGIINVALNLVFVIIFKMDVAGVALATVISQCISAILVVRCMVLDGGAVQLNLRQLRIWPARLKLILKLGIPAGFQGILFSLSNVVIQSSINSFGEIVAAGNAAASNVETFIYAGVNSFYQANISFTSQNLGAGNYKRIRQIAFQAPLCAFLIGLVLGGGATLLGPQLIGLYSESPDVIAAGIVRMQIISAFYALCGMMDVMVGSIRGIGYSVAPTIVSLIGACVLRLVIISTIFQIPQFHVIETVYWSYPISWVLTFIAHVIFFHWGMRRVEQQHLSSF